jgi:[acyl-carrier-protein] S-malonyltransferase
MINIKDLKPKSTAFVFPGQGSQAVGMGRDLADAFPVACAFFQEADTTLGIVLSEVMWNGPEDVLNDTANTQPALFVHSLAAYKVFQHLFPEFIPAFLAGHSLGELSALTAGGALAVDKALRLVRRRGELMKRAGESNPGRMAAILNLGIPELERICELASSGEETVQVANDNAPGQVVISGAEPAVARALELARAAGARRAIPLAVSIAAHSKLMRTIQDEWNQVVLEAGIQDSAVPLIGNVGAAVISTAIAAARRRGINTFIEIGTGSVLLGLIKRIAPEATGISLGTAADFTTLQ